MKIKGSVQQDFYITKDEEIRITLETLKSATKTYPNMFIKNDGKLYVHEHGYHGSGWDEEIREATELDKAMLLVYKALKDFKNSY
jgi:hypothetical protein